MINAIAVAAAPMRFNSFVKMPTVSCFLQIFHENKSMNQNKEYHRTVKFYNKLATALVTFETLWYQQWCKSVEHVLAGLRVRTFDTC